MRPLQLKNLLILLVLTLVQVEGFAGEVIKEAEQGPQATKQIQALINSAGSELENNPVLAHKHAAKALELAEAAKDQHLEHEALHCLANVQYRTGLSAEFLGTALRALHLARAKGDPNAMSRDLQHVSLAYMMNGNKKKALEEARNALALTLPLQDTAAVDRGYQFLLRTLMQAGEYEELHQLAERALARASTNKNALEVARSMRMIGECHLAQGHANSAIPYLNKASSTLEEMGQQVEYIENQLNIAQAFMDLGRTHEMSLTLDQAERSITPGAPWEIKHRALELNYQLAKARMNWREAIALLERAKFEQDSVAVARQDQRMTQLQVNYQLDMKEVDNALLRVENTNRAAVLEDERWDKNALLITLAVLVMVVIGLVFTSRRSIILARNLERKSNLIKAQHNEISAKNMALQRQNVRLAESMLSEEEKEMLIKEMHHRAKNNLQVVDSLLQIQLESLSDVQVKRSLKEAQGRIRSMGLVHEHLYRTANGTKNNLQQHLEELVRNTLVAYGAHDRVSIHVDAPLPIFESETLMPLTLVVNELFTNAIKYAFDGRDSGRISIVVRESGAGYELLFAHLGTGGGNNGPILKDQSFGLELVQMLAAQMNGEVTFPKGNGTSLRLTFQTEKEQLRMAS
ncbi:MAG: tetratricopeptide repeat protein [Flavobacteriales bacterium]|nr:tetratricopeptide repeat protein [Flavobacteriales bacterium]